MATDCSKLARRPFWNHFESGCFFSPKPLFQTIHIRNGSRWCSSNQRLKELLRSSIKANSRGWWFLRRKWNASICRTSYLYACDCTFVLMIFLLLCLHISVVYLTLLSEQHQSLGGGYGNEADQSDDSACTLAFPAFSEDLPINYS